MGCHKGARPITLNMMELDEGTTITEEKVVRLYSPKVPAFICRRFSITFAWPSFCRGGFIWGVGCSVVHIDCLTGNTFLRSPSIHHQKVSFSNWQGLYSFGLFRNFLHWIICSPPRRMNLLFRLLFSRISWWIILVVVGLPGRLFLLPLLCLLLCFHFH